MSAKRAEPRNIAVWAIVGICAINAVATIAAIRIGSDADKADADAGGNERTDKVEIETTRTGQWLLHRDAATGCQYLGTLGGGITPRLAADGSHICTPEASQ